MKYELKWFSSWISEIVGAAIYVFMFILATDKRTQFSNDKVINCLIMASCYVSARLLGGGSLVTWVYENDSENFISYDGIKRGGNGHLSGPLYNPAIMLG